MTILLSSSVRTVKQVKRIVKLQGFKVSILQIQQQLPAIPLYGIREKHTSLRRMVWLKFITF